MHQLGVLEVELVVVVVVEMVEVKRM